MKIGLTKDPCHWNKEAYSFLSTGEIASSKLAAERLPIRDIKVGAHSLAVVVIWSHSVSEGGQADLVILYHGGGAVSFGKDNTSLKHKGFKALRGPDALRTSDIHVSQIPQQVAAMGEDRPVLVMIPQGPHRENFGLIEAESLWDGLKVEGQITADMRNCYVAGHSAGGPLAVKAAHHPDIKGLFLFDPVLQDDLSYIKEFIDERSGPDFHFSAVFNTSTFGKFTRYKGAGKRLQKHAGGRYPVILKEDARGEHAHHSMVSAGTESQDKQVDGRAGYTRDYVPGTGNLELALRQTSHQNLVA